LPHPRRVLFVDAEHDRLLEAVATFLEEFGVFFAVSTVRSSSTMCRSKSLAL
jgi:hypothetical protein